MRNKLDVQSSAVTYARHYCTPATVSQQGRSHLVPGLCSVLQINVEGAVTVVKHIADSHDTSGLSTGRQEVLYGTHNGVLGQLFLDHQSVKQGWLLKPSQHKGDKPYHTVMHPVPGRRVTIEASLAESL